jgi:hypothetical protein
MSKNVLSSISTEIIFLIECGYVRVKSRGNEGAASAGSAHGHMIG